ncbi:MAG: type II secretion system protein, partial [Burkholderiales bacterium]
MKLQRCRARGFTYIALLLFVAIMGVGLAGTGVLFHQQAQREKEKELLFTGGQYRKAIMLYYESTPGSQKMYPRRLED